ncbi:MAG: recombinase family protein, partial [Oscillospiraceae bacterium]|nr:recombinase family protein [Oscillospiraceae bacterium]
EDFLKTASLFILSNQLQDRRYINFSKFSQSTSKEVWKEFVQNAISKIAVFDSKVVEIRFKNGISHKFLYN